MDSPVGIVIVSYNTVDLLCSCLASLQPCTLPLRVVVVDNASSDGTAEVVQSRFPQVELILLPENRGFAAGSNVGIRALCGLATCPSEASPLPSGSAEREVREILLLNPDTVVQEGAIEQMRSFLAGHARVGAVGPRLLHPDGTIQENAFTFPTLWMSFLDMFPLHGRLYHSRLNGRYPEMYREQPFPIDHPLGACLLLRREALEEVDLLDEGYFMYVEEVDLCYRLKQAGWQIYHLPGARVVHYGGQSTRQMPDRMFVELHRSRYRFFGKFYRPAFRGAHRLIVQLGLAWRAQRDRRAHREGRLTVEELAGRQEAYRTIARMR